MITQYPYHKLKGSVPGTWYGKNFLPSGVPQSGPKTYYFSGSDTPELLKQSLQTQPSDWHYRTQHVEYKYNTHGFRAPELDQVDWKNSIVMFGCSQTSGTGLAESETVSAQLQRITGIPVINLGVGGTSMHWSYVNNLTLRNHMPTPLGVVNYWTSCTRLSWYGVNSNTSIGVSTNNTPFDIFYKKYYLLIMKLGLTMADIDHDERFKAQAISDSAKVLWEGTRYSQAAWDSGTASALECEHIGHIDLARDLYHQGPQTALLTAEYFANQLNL